MRALDDRRLRLLIAVGLLLRLAVGAWTMPDRVPLGDEGTYLGESAEIARTGELRTGHFVSPPLYFALLALLQLLPLPFLPIVVALQCLASALTAVPVYRTASRIAGRRAARIASACLLFHPALIAYAHLLWPETLYLLGVALVFDGIASLRPDNRARAAALGLLTGACMLTKSVFGLFTPVLALWWLRRFGRAGALRLCAVFGGAAALAIAPWVIHNQRVHGGAVWIENQGAYNLWTGQDPRDPRLILEEFVAIEGQAERARIGVRRGLDALTADPAGAARRALRRAVNLWGLEYFVLRHAAFGGYGDVSKPALVALFWTLQLATAALLLAAAPGLAWRARGTPLVPVLAYAAVLTAVVALTVVATRFAVPFAFPLCVGAGVALAEPRAALRPWRGRAALACALALLAVSATRPVFAPWWLGSFQRVEELRSADWFFLRY